MANRTKQKKDAGRHVLKMDILHGLTGKIL